MAKTTSKKPRKTATIRAKTQRSSPRSATGGERRRGPGRDGVGDNVRDAVADALVDALLDLADDCAELAADLDTAMTADRAGEAVAAIGAASVRLDRLVRAMATLPVDPQALVAAREAARALPPVAAPSSPQ